MNTCEEFEIAIEIQQHGALSEPRRAELVAHLESCKSCRQYASRAKNTTAAMRASPGPLNKPLVWLKLKERISAQQKQDRASWFLGASVAFLVGGLLLIGYDFHPASWFAIPVATVTVLSIGIKYANKWSDKVQEADTEEELLAVYRSELDRRIAITKRDRWFLPFFIPALGILFAWQGWWSSLERTTALAAILASFATQALRIHFVDLPQLLRQRRELD